MKAEFFHREIHTATLHCNIYIFLISFQFHIHTKSILDWENPIITKMLDRKIQTDKMSVKTSQYGKVLDCFNKSEGVWIFNPTFLESIDSYSNM